MHKHLESRATEMLRNSQTIIKGHFALPGDLYHTSEWLDEKMLFRSYRVSRELSEELHQRALHELERFQVIVGVSDVGALLGQQLAGHYDGERVRDEPEITLAIAEEVNPGSFRIAHGGRRDLDARRVVIVDDILATGRSLAGMKELVERAGGVVVGALVVAKRGEPNTDLRRKLPQKVLALADRPMTIYEKNQCPLCDENLIPLNRDFGAGHRAITVSRQ